MTVTLDRVASKQKTWLGSQVCVDSDRIPVNPTHVVYRQVDLLQERLLKECIRGDLYNIIIIQQHSLNAVGKVGRGQNLDLVEPDVEMFDLDAGFDAKVIVEGDKVVEVEVKPDEATRQHGVVKFSEPVSTAD